MADASACLEQSNEESTCCSHLRKCFLFWFNLLIKKGNCKRHKRRGNHGMTPEDWKWVRHNFWPLHILFFCGIPCSWNEFQYMFCWSIIYQNKKIKKTKRFGGNEVRSSQSPLPCFRGQQRQKAKTLPVHIYGYNNEHAVIVALLLSVPRHRFQKSPFSRVENAGVV